MDQNKLVFIRRKGSSSFDSNPAEVVSCVRDRAYCYVTFKGNLRCYSFAHENVAICTLRETLEANQCRAARWKDGRKTPLRDLLRVSFYESDNPDFEDRVLVQFSQGGQQIYAQSELSITCNPCKRQQQGVLGYLASISKALATCDTTGNPDIDEYLTRQYNELGEPTINATAARCMAHPTNSANTMNPVTGTIIYPFGTNLSQMEAVHNALANTLSIIEGPPGTGKTQTILNIVANLIVRDQSVLLVSPNNEATKNVVDKLASKGLGFVVAPLGNQANCFEFIESQRGYPSELYGWGLSEAQRAVLDSKVSKAANDSRELYTTQRACAQLREALKEWKLEKEVFRKRFPNVAELSHPPDINEKALEQLRDIIAKQSRKNDRIRFLTKVRGRFGSGIGKWADYARSPVDFELRINATLLNVRSKRLQSELMQLEDEIKTGASSYHLQSLARSSNRLLKDAIYRHYCVGGSIPSQRIRFAYQDLRNKSDKVRTEYPVITSTTNAARRQLGRDAKQFDWVIVDESSQADLVTGFLALSCARHAVVVGDTRQLPYVVTKEAAEASERVFSAADVADRYRYTSESLLSCLERCITEEGLNAPVTLLREHYRCHPDIIGFCNKQFYDGELVVMTKGGQSPHALQVFLTQDENYDRSANYNHVQAELVSEEVVPKLLLEFAPDDVGIVTPYRRQADGLSEKQWSLSPIEIMTVHKYQGREKNAMVFVTCTNDTNAFLDNPNLVNVAISRAKDALVLVASPRITKGVGNLADFARYVAFRNGKVIQTEACSAFDLVYPTRLEERLEYLKHRNASGDQYSEVRVETELVSALKAAGLSSRFGYARNYPLKQFIAEGISLSKRERQFVESSAHADFLVFRKIDSRVVYEIEVNGSQHASQIQRGRDELKRSILDKAGVPHAGILTNEAKHELSRHIAAIVAELQASDTGNRKTSNVVQDS